MDVLLKDLKIMLALLGGSGGWLLGGVDSLVYALVAFVAIDYLYNRPPAGSLREENFQ